MAALAGTTLVWPGTELDKVWVLNKAAYRHLSPAGRPVGGLFLLLSFTLVIASVGWSKRLPSLQEHRLERTGFAVNPGHDLDYNATILKKATETSMGILAESSGTQARTFCGFFFTTVGALRAGFLERFASGFFDSI